MPPQQFHQLPYCFLPLATDADRPKERVAKSTSISTLATSMTLLKYDVFELALASQWGHLSHVELYYRVLLRHASIVDSSVTNMVVLATCKPFVDG